MRRETFVVLVPLALAGCYSTGLEPPDRPGPTDAGTGTPDADAPIPSGLPAPTAARPAIAGGTLHVLADGRAVVGHPQHAAVSVVEGAAVVGSVPMPDAGVPGRITSDAAGRVHVVLTNRGELVTLDPSGPSILARRHLCPEPRGVAVDGERLHVACASGELVTLPTAGGPATRRLRLDDDLRDVVVQGDRLYVSRFRSAELLTLDAEGRVIDRRSPQARTVTASMRREPTRLTFVPNVAYRLRPLPDGGVAMLHQRSVVDPIDVGTDGYSGGGDDCPNGVVHAAITRFPPDGEPSAGGPIAFASLVVDFALDAGGETYFMASAALPHDVLPIPEVSGSVRSVAASSLDQPCLDVGPRMVSPEPSSAVELAPDGRVIALSTDGDTLFVQPTRGAPMTLTVAGAIGPDPGYRLFHAATPAMLACASCHPEGAEDGFTWNFQPAGPRRTQTLTGGILDTAPFHWSGDQPGMRDIMQGTFTERMSAPFSSGDVDAIARWIDALPAPAGDLRDAEAIARGEALFGGDAGCAGCHSGASLTDDLNHDVGTGEPFQTPSLVGVAYRAPFLHDGRAPTLEQIFVAGHGEAHRLGAEERRDLVTYLRSL